MCWWVPVIQARPEIGRHDRRPAADRRLAGDRAVEARADDRQRGVAVADLHLAPGVQHGHARAAAGAGRRAVDLAGLDDDGVRAGERAVAPLERAGELAERNMRPVRIFGVDEAELRVGRAR